MVYLLTSAAAFLPALGWRGWFVHLGRLAGSLAWFAAGSLIVDHLAIGEERYWRAFAAQCVVLVVWMLPAIVAWGRRHQWGGLLR
jgi:hypothetical protein